MAWNYPKGCPKNREEAIALMMTVKEEDIDLSDIPEGMKIRSTTR